MRAAMSVRQLSTLLVLLASSMACDANSFETQQQGKPTPTSTKIPDIVGGTKVAPWQAPWQVALVSAAGNPAAGVFCGGTLIGSQWVLTAAHCFYERDTCRKIPPQAIFVAYGSTDLGKKVSLIAAAEFIHPETYKCSEKSHDIGLIRLEEHLGVSSFIKLPSATEMSELASAGRQLMVAGWGVTDEKSEIKSRFLLEVSVPVVEYSACQKVYGAILPKGAICAGEVGKDSCSGDSGGPLYRRLQNPDKAVQLGVVSFGEGCGRDKTPGVYTSIADYFDWISESTKSKPCTQQDVIEGRC